ncbi:MAG: alpha-amylase/4-alpha-glucanotransferase domain-containing protein [Candidatus Eisenbacteria bacterium]
MNRVSLVICIHNHQPVGNLQGVFEHAYEHAYEPFLAAMEESPDVRFVLHNTGPLLEWFEDRAPDYLTRVRALVDRGQVEILGGAFYEPILATIPARDAVGQIRRMTSYVEERFGARPRGMWLAERVWEPHLARVVAEAGIEYLPVDDYEFQLTGVPAEDLNGYFITEDQGVPLKVFPISKSLRYAIPFQDPSVTIEALRSLSERGPGLCAVFGDDGEKFGVWPGTHAHVYGNGWLRRFLQALSANSDWLKTTTFADVVDSVPARGRVYLPASSYPEMMEWALPTRARRTYERMLDTLKAENRFDEWGPYLSGGTWRGFIAKYDESNLMVRKMMRVSGKLDLARKTIERLRESDDLGHATREAGAGREPAVDPAAADEAATELWRGQCNCAYWHGVFGGLYLPHLRAAVYEHLIRAENLIESARGDRWSALQIVDHDLDGNDEVLLETHWANVYVAPARGGTVFELDLREAAVNLLGTMSRYEEAYHDAVKAAGEASAGEAPRGDDGHAGSEAPSGGEFPNENVSSIHDGFAPREKGLERLAVPDRLPRRAAVDRFLPVDTKRVGLEQDEVDDLGDFADGEYAFEPSRLEGGLGVVMRRNGLVAGVPTTVRKKVCVEPDGVTGVEYVVSPEENVDALFTSEWNLAFLTGDEEYTWFEHEGGERRAASARQTLTGVTELHLNDRLRGIRLHLSFEPACTVWTYPLETASQSEGGLERVFQATTIVAVWRLDAGATRERAETGGGTRFAVSLRTESPGTDSLKG